MPSKAVFELAPDDSYELVVGKFCSVAEHSGIDVAVHGNRLVLAWKDRGFVRKVSAVVLEVDTGEPEKVPEPEDQEQT